ncbi:MAG: protein YgfX [Sideroxydans sp.]
MTLVTGASQRHFKIRSSRRLLVFIFISYSLSLFVLSSFAWSLIWKALTGVLALSLCIYLALRDANLRMPHSCVAFRLEAENKISLFLRNGQHVAGTLSARSWVSTSIVILVLRYNEHATRTILVLPDSMSKDAFRRLRVTLKWN